MILPVTFPMGGANDSEYLKNLSWTVCGANHCIAPSQSAYISLMPDISVPKARTIFDSCWASRTASASISALRHFSRTASLFANSVYRRRDFSYAWYIVNGHTSRYVLRKWNRLPSSACSFRFSGWSENEPSRRYSSGIGWSQDPQTVSEGGDMDDVGDLRETRQSVSGRLQDGSPASAGALRWDEW